MLIIVTLPKRNRRDIVVDDVAYHWTIGTKDDHRRGTATVQHAPGRGARLIIDVVGTLLPADVANAIRFAIELGWKPAESGQEVWIGFCDEYSETDKRFVARTASDPPYWSVPRTDYKR